MDAREAEAALEGLPLIIGAEGAIVEIRALVAKCLTAGVPALIGPCPGKS